MSGKRTDCYKSLLYLWNLKTSSSMITKRYVLIYQSLEIDGLFVIEFGVGDGQINSK